MKKKVFTVLAALALVFGISFTLTNSAQAASWGAKTLYTTPKSVRGTWYAKQGKKVKKYTITAHTLNGVKMYKPLSDKQHDKYITKLSNLPTKQFRRTSNYLESHQLEAHNIKYNGVKGFNAIGWLSGAGDGIFYTPTTQTVNGKKVKALRLGTGADNHLQVYAYKNRNLAR